MPWLVPRPYGSWNQTTIAAANECGYPGTVLWDVTVDGSKIQTTYGSIRPGDIVLPLHYTTNFQLGIDTLAAELSRLGLHPAPLANYLPPSFARPPPPPNRLTSVVVPPHDADERQRRPRVRLRRSGRPSDHR